jgi:anthranilate synthase component 2
MKALLIDNFDSFTYILKDLIAQCGVELDVYRNNRSELLEMNVVAYDFIVISPGPSSPEQAGNLMPFLRKNFQLVPLLGICLGHQAIGQLFGAQLVKANLPRHGKIDTIHQSDYTHMFKHCKPEFKVTRYHSLVLQNMPEMLEVTAVCKDEVMALKHKKLPIWGLQFHPESCASENGKQLVLNFISMVKNIAPNKI